MSPRDSIDGIVEHVAEWISLNVHGVVWIRYKSDVSRDECIEKLNRYLACPPINFDPSDPKLAAVWLETLLDNIPLSDPLPVICLKFPIMLGESEAVLVDAFSSLNLRRENLIKRPIIQLWWIQEHLSPLVENAAPDLTSWFKIRLTLSEAQGLKISDSESWLDATAFNRLRMEPDTVREQSLDAASKLVELSRKRTDSNAQGDLAVALVSLSLRLAAMGMLDESLERAAEAVNLYRDLTERNPEVFPSDLAMSLSHLANRQSEVGQLDEALATSEEAAKLWSKLPDQKSEAYLRNMAVSLSNLAIMQRAVGMQHEALSTAEKALNLRRELAARNREAFLPDLAVSLNNLASLQGAVGKREEALETAQDAVKIRKELVEWNREAFLPDLAGSLNNLANRQNEVGKSEEALATALEAVKLRRELTWRNRDAFLPDLATSLGALSQIHASRGEHDLAQSNLHEAMTLIMPFFEQHPEAFSLLTLQLEKAYRRACQQTSHPPDQALLDRIAAKLPPQ